MLRKWVIPGALCCFVLILSSFVSGQADQLFQSQCGSCHSKSGAPTPVGQKLGVLDLRSDEVQNLDDKELFNGIAYGAGHKKYPHGFARRGLSPEQITSLVTYIRGMRKPAGKAEAHKPVHRHS